MNFHLYVIKDVKSSYQPQVYVFANDDIAKRWFYQMYRDAVDREPNSPLASFPEDFNLYCIGSFDTELGEVRSYQSTYVCCLKDFKEV